jgi:outer membrane protein assembly factor BamA
MRISKLLRLVIAACAIAGSRLSIAQPLTGPNGGPTTLGALSKATPAPISANPAPSIVAARPAGLKSGQKYIRSITIKVGEIFEDNSGTLYSVANAVKVSTKESVIRTELLFKEGDVFDPYLVRQTARNLRLQRFLRDIRVIPTFDGDAVDVAVSARDAWTLIPFLSYSSGTGQRNRGIGVSEGNLMGGATRLDTRYQENASRKTYAMAVTDPQFLGTRLGATAGYADRSDGYAYQAALGLPFRHLLQRDSWLIDFSQQNTIGRLFEAGEEFYIFRQHLDEFQALYTFAGPGAHPATQDDPYTGIFKGQTVLSQQYSVGWNYQSASFYQADQQDYEDLDLDPATVGNDPAQLASNRRFSGPMVQYRNIQPEFISMNYIDRFDRVEDYNLGDESLVNMVFSPRTLGSQENSFLFNANRSRGWRFSERSFLRGELGGASRFDKDQLNNTLLRGEAKYYSVIGDYFAGDRFLGRHTLASQFFLDVGEDLDNDRQLLLGADNALRGYEINTFEGDKRMALSLEERAHLADDVFQLVSIGTAVFLDVGGTTRDSLYSIISDDLYGDVGFGLRLCFPRASGGGIVRMDIALPLRDGPDGSNAWEPRVVFAAGQLFGARLRSEVVGAENASSGIGFDR